MSLRLSLATSPAFDLLADLASRRERIAYADFAFALGLGSPRALGWLLGLLLGWCKAGRLPLLPILVVRRADGLPSGSYDAATITAESERVFDHDWRRAARPIAADLVAFVPPAVPRPARPLSEEARPC